MPFLILTLGARLWVECVLQTRRTGSLTCQRHLLMRRSNVPADKCLGWLTASAIFEQSELELIVIDFGCP